MFDGTVPLISNSVSEVVKLSPLFGAVILTPPVELAFGRFDVVELSAFASAVAGVVVALSITDLSTLRVSIVTSL